MNSTNFSYLRSVKKFDPSVIKGANRMTDKTAIEKAKEALNRAGSLLANQGYPTKYIKEAIAAIEAEKPADDLKALVYDIAIDCACIQKPKDYDVYERSAINKIQQYAVDYHAKQCKACKALPEEL